jgi:hypothetical protein
MRPSPPPQSVEQYTDRDDPLRDAGMSAERGRRRPRLDHKPTRRPVATSGMSSRA